jgi:hypothetical protein
MENSGHCLPRGTETKLFDPRDSPAGIGTELLDASVVKRGDQWWMYLAGPNDHAEGNACFPEFPAI